jgi:hypothetical protein
MADSPLTPLSSTGTAKICNDTGEMSSDFCDMFQDFYLAVQ